MKKKVQEEQADAVQRFLKGENPAALCSALGKSTRCYTSGWHGIAPMIPFGVKTFRGDHIPVPIELLRRSKISWKWCE